MDKLVSMDITHPAYPGTFVELQSAFLKDSKWENVMALGLVFRKHFLVQESTFRVGPVLMEAYSLIQFCRYDEARSVLEYGKFYAKKFNRQDDLLKIQKAQELEKLSKLYVNAHPPLAETPKFEANELEWKLEPEQDGIFKVLDKIKIRTESQCKS